MRQAEQRWLAAINTAKLRKDAAAYHDVRIKTKTLRYMIESVSRFVELPGAEETTEWLKIIQDELGEWHDEIELTRRVTALLSKDADYQADDAVAALIKSLRDRAQANTHFVSEVVTFTIRGSEGKPPHRLRTLLVNKGLRARNCSPKSLQRSRLPLFLFPKRCEGTPLRS